MAGVTSAVRRALLYGLQPLSERVAYQKLIFLNST